MRPILGLVLTLLVACGGASDSDAGGEGCDSCGDGDICLVHFDDDGTERESCEPLPASCAGDDSCECRGDMYDLCDDGFLGVGCSDTTPPTIISCNP